MSTWTRRRTLAALLAGGVSGVPITLAAASAQRKARTRAPGDYMSISEREAVERLKSDVAREPTGDSNFRDRGLVLYDWMNASALAGAYTHPDLPSLVAGLYAPDFSKRGDRQRNNAFTSVDRYVRTLTALEKNPGLCGAMVAKTDGPLFVDSYVEFQQIYTVGDADILPGGGLILPNHFYFASEELQASNPKGDNYVSLKSSNPEFRFEIDSYPIAGMFSSRLGVGEAPRVFFRVTAGRLTKGDTLTVTYGDRRGGSRGLKLIHISNSAIRFPFWLLTEKNGILLTPREASLPVLGGPAAGVHAFVPSVVAVGETFSMTVRTEDRFRNLATGGAPAWTLSIDGKPFRKVAASRDAIATLKDVRFDKPGVYRIAIASDDGRITGTSDPVLVETQPTERIYWGETHGHCGFSEGMGRVDDYFAFARDEARLDFTTLSEHDIWLDAREWEDMRDATRRFNRPGEFITFMGYEWTVVAAHGGHHNVIFRGIDGVQPVTSQRHPSLKDLYLGIRKAYRPKDVMIIPHAHMTGDAAQNDPELEPLVEIVSEHGTFEWLGRRYLANGFQLGFVGAGDDHIGHPGYKPRPLGRYYFDGYGGLAAVYAPAKQRDALFDAMKARRTYATNSARMILRTALNGRRMGEIIPSADVRTIEGVVHGTAPIELITLVKNGVDHEVLSFDTPDPRGGPDDIVEIRFTSTSDPGAPLVPSRSIRAWVGKIIVEGAAVKSVSSSQVEALNYLTEWTRPNPVKAEEVDFRLVTRGDSKAVRLRLDGDLSRVKVRVLLTEGRSPFDMVLAVPAPGQPPATATARDRDPGGERTSGGEFADQVAVRRIRPAAAPDRSFRFVDRRDPHDGDNYYVRVVQADGGAAWSSPAWIGKVAKARTT